MNKIVRLKLPEPFHSAILRLYPLAECIVSEAYLDDGYQPNGFPKIREYLDITQAEPVCDCLSKVFVNGKVIYLLLEDKGTGDYRKAQMGIAQLENSYIKAKNKNITIERIILCNFKPDNRIFKSVDSLEHPLKILRNNISNEDIRIDRSIPILLYNERGK